MMRNLVSLRSGKGNPPAMASGSIMAAPPQMPADDGCLTASPPPHRLSRDLRCPPPCLLLSPYGRLGRQATGKKGLGVSKMVSGRQLERSRCGEAHLLTTAHTWANQSQIIWKQLAPPSLCCPRVTYPFLVASHTLVSAQESTTPPPSATAASPLPKHPCRLALPTSAC